MNYTAINIFLIACSVVNCSYLQSTSASHLQSTSASHLESTSASHLESISASHLESTSASHLESTSPSHQQTVSDPGASHLESLSDPGACHQQSTSDQGASHQQSTSDQGASRLESTSDPRASLDEVYNISSEIKECVRDAATLIGLPEATTYACAIKVFASNPNLIHEFVRAIFANLGLTQAEELFIEPSDSVKFNLLEELKKIYYQNPSLALDIAKLCFDFHLYHACEYSLFQMRIDVLLVFSTPDPLQTKMLNLLSRAEEFEACPVCLEQMSGCATAILACRHILCEECLTCLHNSIIQGFVQFKQCPKCRADIREYEVCVPSGDGFFRSRREAIGVNIPRRNGAFHDEDEDFDLFIDSLLENFHVREDSLFLHVREDSLFLDVREDSFNHHLFAHHHQMGSASSIFHCCVMSVVIMALVSVVYSYTRSPIITCVLGCAYGFTLLSNIRRSRQNFRRFG